MLLVFFVFNKTSILKSQSRCCVVGTRSWGGISAVYLLLKDKNKPAPPSAAVVAAAAAAAATLASVGKLCSFCSDGQKNSKHT